MIALVVTVISFGTISQPLNADTLNSDGSTIENTSGNEVSPFMIDGGNNGIVTSETVRYTVTNSGKQSVANLIGAFIMSKVPTKLTKSTLVNWAATEGMGLVSIEPAYIETYNYKVRDGSNCFRHYAVVNHYSNDSYVTLVNTSQIETSLECS